MKSATDTMLEMGCLPQPHAGRLLQDCLGEEALAVLGDMPHLWYLRDEANWWFCPRPGHEQAWLALLKRQFEPVLMMRDAMENPTGFPLSFFLRLSGQLSGGDALLDLRSQPFTLISALEPGEMKHLLPQLPGWKTRCPPQAAWLHALPHQVRWQGQDDTWHEL